MALSEISGVLVEMRKATITFVMSVCLSVRPSARYNSPPTDFGKF